MKTLLRATGIFGIILIMGSCGSMNSFTKKHHSHRKWKKAETAEVEDKQGSNREISAPTTRRGVAQDAPEKQSDIQPVKRSSNVAIETSKPTIEQPISTTHDHAAPVDDINLDNDLQEEPVSHQEEEVGQVEERPRGVTSTDNTTDEMTILLVIIAIIGLPWLSMILYEGATTRTILILVLSLLGYGYFFTPFFGIALLVAIVWTVLILLGFA